jgi:hypothetical protein
MKLAPQDSWGKVKIPRLKLINGSAPRDGEGWLEVPRLTLPEQYSSLVGIPIIGLPENHHVEFPIDTTYISLSCSAWQPYLDRSGGWGAFMGQVWRRRENVSYTSLCDAEAFCRRPRLSVDHVEGFNEGGSWRAANLAEVPLPAGGEEARSGDLL